MKKIIGASITSLILLFSTSSFALVDQIVMKNYLIQRMQGFVASKSIPNSIRNLNLKVVEGSFKYEKQIIESAKLKVSGKYEDMNVFKAFINVTDTKTQKLYRLSMKFLTIGDVYLVNDKRFKETNEFSTDDGVIFKVFPDEEYSLVIKICPNGTYLTDAEEIKRI